MKVKAAKEGVMVRLIVNGMPLFVTSASVEVDENNPEVREQIEPLVTQRAAATWAAVEVLVNRFLVGGRIVGTYPWGE